MPKFVMEWTTENWHRAVIEADNEDVALDKLIEVFDLDETVYDRDYIQEDSVEIVGEYIEEDWHGGIYGG